MLKWYVYIFFNEDWGVPFYVGKGTDNRMNEIRGRNKQIQTIYQKYNCSSRKIMSFSKEKDAYEFEKFLKEDLKNKGFPIIDKEIILNHEAQRAGIEKAKKAGKYKGRKEVCIEENVFENLLNKYNTREINKKQFALLLKVSRPTLDKLLKKYEESHPWCKSTAV